MAKKIKSVAVIDNNKDRVMITGNYITSIIKNAKDISCVPFIQIFVKDKSKKYKLNCMVEEIK
jgi:hypothetical protein